MEGDIEAERRADLHKLEQVMGSMWKREMKKLKRKEDRGEKNQDEKQTTRNLAFQLVQATQVSAQATHVMATASAKVVNAMVDAGDIDKKH